MRHLKIGENKMSDIIIKGARQHNLKNINLNIPKKKFVVVTGVSGSGKSSLVFDTIFTEAQRQLIETFSAFARRRLPKLSRPDVDEIENISPVIVIDQKRMGRTPRSTVGTATEIYNYLRLLYARIGKPFVGYSNVFSFNNPTGMCPACKGLGRELDVNLDAILDWDKTLNQGAVTHPEFKVGGWFMKNIIFSGLLDPDKPVKDFSEKELDILLHKDKKIVVESTAKQFHNIHFEGIIRNLKRRHLNREESRQMYQQYFDFIPCTKCNGDRLNNQILKCKIKGKNIADLTKMELPELNSWLKKIKGPIAEPIVRKATQSLEILIDIGVGYLSLDRQTNTLSGGEAQRVKMARQMGCNLVDLIYVLDEPSIGLHPRDINNLIELLKRLRDKDNTVLVVEHDPEVMQAADYLIDIGPGAGTRGGKVVFKGTLKELKKSDTKTAQYLSKNKKNKYQRKKGKGAIKIKNASVHNLKNVSVDIPKGVFTCVTGVAGSGKSSLLNDWLAKKETKAVVIDQTSAGRSSRSNVATYTEIFSPVRKLFSKSTGKPAELFSFNSKGACEKCKGSGKLKVEMFFLDTVDVACDQCKGKRYKEEVLELKFQNKSIAELLALTVQEALSFFKEKDILKRLKILEDVGLDYLQLGQSLSTLSGGEAQRIKLASELHKKGNIYIMDEPTTGLHMADIERLVKIIKRLVEQDNSVIVIEHNLDVIKQADYIIDLGPEGGSAGGEVIAQGTPEEIIKTKKAHTARYLKNVL